MAEKRFLVSPAVWLMVLVFMSSLITIITLADNQPSFKVECDFGQKTSISNGNYSANITGKLSAKFGNARHCWITHRMSSGIVRFFLNTVNVTNNDSKLYVMVMKEAEVLFLGAADSSYLTNGNRYHFHTCPRESAKKETKLQLLVLGKPENGSFSVQVYLDQSSLRVSESSSGVKTIQVRKDGLSHVLILDIQEGHLFELHQITATSHENKMKCTLSISQDCLAFQRQGFSQNGSSIRLTFTTFGRITLSQYSYPRITAGRWYIGVYAKENQLKDFQEKEVQITVKTAFKHKSMAGKSLPAMYMFLATLLGGVAIAVFTHFCFNSDFEETQMFFYDEEDMNNFNMGEYSNNMSRILQNTLKPMSKKTFSVRGWVSVICIHWFGKGMKTYSYITGVLAISFMVGSAQFVIALWSDMIKSGNRDKCYYNDGCYRPIAISDIPSNFMLSNVPYVILGVLLALSFSLREAISRDYENMHEREKESSQEVPHVKKIIPYDYSLSYAFSWALVFEGLFSATYHLCPSRLTFQFDSAFMFIISGLVVVALYNSHINRFLEGKKSKKLSSEAIIQAPKYFLFFVAPLLILNYVGSLEDTEKLPYSMEVMFWIALIIWMIAMYCWMLKKVGVPFNLEECRKPKGALKWFWVLLFPILLLLIGNKLKDWSQFFLFSCITAVALSIAGMITLNLVVSCKRCHCTLNWCCPESTFGKIERSCRILFCIICFLFWVFAMYFFKIKSTTRKVAAPSISRTFNRECVLWDFFDYHDIWHMLSSFALFMSAYLLIYVTRKSEKWYYMNSLYDSIKNQRNLGGSHQTKLDEQGENTEFLAQGGSDGVKDAWSTVTYV